MMKKYKYLLFDADNTLFDFNRSERNALALTFSYFGVTLDDGQHAVYHKINDDLWKELEKGAVTRAELKVLRFERFKDHLGREELNAADIADRYIEELSKQSILIDGAVEVCEKLSRTYPLYLITNGITVVQRRRFDSSVIKRYFKDIFISEEMGEAKPSSAYFKTVSVKIGDKDPANYVVIGDSLSSDIKGAVNFGCDSIWISPDGTISDLPTYTVKNLCGLSDIL